MEIKASDNSILHICWGQIKNQKSVLSRIEAAKTALKPSSSIEGRQEEATYLPVATVQP